MKCAVKWVAAAANKLYDLCTCVVKESLIIILIFIIIRKSIGVNNCQPPKVQKNLHVHCNSWQNQ